MFYVGRLEYTLHSLRLPQGLSPSIEQQEMEGSGSEIYSAAAL